MITRIEKGIFVKSFGDFLNLCNTNSAKFSKFDFNNAILFQIKVFRKNIKETTLVNYFAKVTAS